MTSVVRLTLAYDGTRFHGWAKQREQRTVEGVLQTALHRFLRDVPKLSVAGRTDAGVHARGQVVSFEAADVVDVGRLQPGLNALLGPEVVVTDARVVSDGFHARHSATAREYRYRIETGPYPNPFIARSVGLVEVTARVDSCLHQMVRSLVGTLVLVGKGRVDPDRVKVILAARDRSAAAQMAPPHGLTLEHVSYGRR